MWAMRGEWYCKQVESLAFYLALGCKKGAP